MYVYYMRVVSAPYCMCYVFIKLKLCSAPHLRSLVAYWY